MPHDPQLDPAAILAALSMPTAKSIAAVDGGSDTAIWRVTYGAESYALRVFRPEQVESCQRELAAMQIARASQIPVPAVRASGFWQDRPVVLLAWCAGVPLGAALQAQPWRVWSLGRAFGRMQARIHAIPAREDWCARRTDWIAWAGPHDQRLRAALLQRAKTTPACIHLDYHLSNVLTDGRRITAVLDWVNSRVGDPRADFARTYTILMVEPYTAERQSMLLSVMRRMLTWSWQRGYEEVAGALPDMACFYAWAGSAMQNDLARRVDDPDSWWQARHLAQIRDWTMSWQRQVAIDD